LLAEADALRSLGMDRRAGLWAVKALAPEAKVETEAPLLALMGPPAEAPVRLPAMRLPAHVAEDYRTTSLSLKAHPCAFFRPLLTGMGAVTAARLRGMKDGARLCVGGLVLIRQRPGTAKGVVFVTLEDETGSANAVVWQASSPQPPHRDGLALPGGPRPPAARRRSDPRGRRALHRPDRAGSGS